MEQEINNNQEEIFLAARVGWLGTGLTLERSKGDQMSPPGFSDLRIEALKQSKWNF